MLGLLLFHRLVFWGLRRFRSLHRFLHFGRLRWGLHSLRLGLSRLGLNWLCRSSLLRSLGRWRIGVKCALRVRLGSRVRFLAGEIVSEQLSAPLQLLGFGEVGLPRFGFLFALC